MNEKADGPKTRKPSREFLAKLGQDALGTSIIVGAAVGTGMAVYALGKKIGNAVSSRGDARSDDQ